MTFSQLSHLFLQSHERAKSAANTRIFYRTQLAQLQQVFGTTPIDQLGPGDVLDALERTSHGKTDSTRRSRAVALQQLQRFALDNSLIDRPWLKKIPKPPQGRRTRIPTADETRQLLQHSTAAFRLIYEALRVSGARPGELCRAQIADYDREAGTITLVEHKTARKSGRPRVIAVGQRLARQLRLAIGRRRTGPIFLSPRGVAWTVNNLSSQFARLRDHAGVSRELVLYSARHEAGTAFCAAHGILVASRLLGHSTIATTQRYAHPDVEALRTAQDAGGVR